MNKKHIILFSSLALSLFSMTTQTFATPNIITSKTDNNQCKVYVNGHFLQTLSSSDQFTWEYPDGKVSQTTGKSCQTGKPNWDSIQSGPLQKRNYKQVPEMLRFWYGFYAESRSGFKQLSSDWTIPQKLENYPKSGALGFWMGLQPRQGQYRDTYWQDVLLQSSMSWSNLNKKLHWTAYNAFCQSDAAFCGSGKEVIPGKQDTRIHSTMTHLAKTETLPSRWMAVWHFNKTGAKHYFVIPDSAIENLFSKTEYCYQGSCRFPTGLIAQEYQMPKVLDLSQLINLFPKDKQIVYSNVKSKTITGSAVNWKNYFLLTGEATNSKHITSLAALNSYVDNLKGQMEYSNCFYHLMQQIHLKKVKTADGYDMSWTLPQHNPPQCYDAFYKGM